MPWLEAFRKHYTSKPDVLRGIFTACRAGRDWAFESARHLTLSLDTTAQRPEWRGDVLRQALSGRDSQPTSVERGAHSP